jgi:hypothetical protein
MAFWLDPSGAADFAAAREAPFQPIANSNFGNHRGALWLRVAIDNPGPPAERVLRVGPAMLEHVDLWQRYCFTKEPEEFLSKIGFRETRAYVQRVLGSREHYAALEGPDPP